MKLFRAIPGSPALLAVLYTVLLLLGGCMASENPDLLNAPLAEESIRVRLLNLAGDEDARELQLEGARRTDATPFAGLSAPVSAPADSARASVLRNAVEDYATDYKVRFSRNTMFTLIALPSVDRSTAVDTLLVLSASDTAEVRSGRVSYVRFLNAYPQSGIQFSLRLGCPNGTTLAPQAGFGGIGSRTELAPGDYTVSLLSQIGSEPSPAGFYSMTITDNSDFTLILYKSNDGTPRLLLLHDRGVGPTALQQLPSVEASTARLRTLNFSSQTIDISKINAGGADDVIARGIAPLTADAFANVTACTSPSEDTLRISGGTMHMAGVPLEVFKDFTVLTIDSGAGTANYSIVLPPTSGASPDSATIRTVNLAWGMPALEISVGARTTVGNSYITGQVLSAALEFGTAGAPTRLAPGPAPLVVFTNGPKLLRTTAYVDQIRAGGRYMLVATRAGDNLQLTLFDEDNGSVHALTFLEEGVFTQIVNTVTDAEQLQVSFGSVIGNRNLFYGSALATVLPAGPQTVVAAGRQESVTLQQGLRTLVVLSGSAANPDIRAYTEPPMAAPVSEVRSRYINAAPGMAALTVALDHKGGTRLGDNLPYLGISPIYSSPLNRKVTLVFLDNAENIVLERNNIPLSLGQNFTIIFAGNAASGYRAIILQEF